MKTLITPLLLLISITLFSQTKTEKSDSIIGYKYSVVEKQDTFTLRVVYNQYNYNITPDSLFHYNMKSRRHYNALKKTKYKVFENYIDFKPLHQRDIIYFRN